MGTKSQFFRAFVEGQTISDGREVTAEMIDQVVETFNTDSYLPGINIEHIAGFIPHALWTGSQRRRRSVSRRRGRLLMPNEHAAVTTDTIMITLAVSAAVSVRWPIL